MHHLAEATGAVARRRGFAVGQIQPAEGVAEDLTQLFEARFLERRAVIIGVEVVDADDRRPGLEETPGEAEADGAMRHR